MHKIVIINNWLISGGAEKQGLILAKTLNKHFKIYFCIYYTHKIEDKFMREIEENNIELILLKGNHLSKFYNFYNFCKREKVSMIISYLFMGNILNSLIGKLLQVKHRIGGIRNSKHSTFKNYIQRFIHNRFLTLSISNSYNGKNECTNYGYNSDKMIVIHNCFEFKECLHKKKENTKVNVITVARFVSQKDYLTAIRSVHYAIKNSETKNIHYTILGYGELESQVRNWIVEYNLTDNVTIVINPKNINEYLAQADIYLSTSLFEGLSNSIMEGMSFSLPIVATNIGDNCELVKEGSNGFLANIGDFELLGNQLLKLVNDDKLRVEYGKNSLYHLKENFSSEKFEKNYLTIINQLLEESR